MLTIKNLNKKFENKKVLDNLNLELENGKIIGLLGPNGCGKTTLLKILANLSNADSGEILLNGKNIDYTSNKDIAFLADVPFMKKSLTIMKAIEFFKYFHEDFDELKALKLMDHLKLNYNEKISNLSKGNIEKVHLVLTLSRNAKLYILDEPIAGVDIIVRKEILKLISQNLNENSIAIITTHLIRDIEQIFDEVCFLKNGNIDKVYNLEDIRENLNKSAEDLYIEYFGGVQND